MAYSKCPNRECGRREDGASVYQCKKCGGYGCMKGMLGGYFGPYSGCWTHTKCPHCGEKDAKKHIGSIRS